MDDLGRNFLIEKTRLQLLEIKEKFVRYGISLDELQALLDGEIAKATVNQNADGIAEPANPNARRNQIARINRQLAKQGEKLRTSSERERHNLGDYHVIDIHGNYVVYLNVDLDALEADLRNVA